MRARGDVSALKEIAQISRVAINVFLTARYQTGARVAKERGMSAMEIAQLQPCEPVHVDPDILASLHARLGQVGAEQALTSAIEQALARLAAVKRAASSGNLDGVAQLSLCLAELAEQTGMITCARVAQVVADTAAQGDQVALSAALARLDRIGDRSMLAVWGLEDISG